MKTVAIIEDEPLARSIIKNYLTAYSNLLEFVGEAGNGFDGLKLIQNKKPDLVFLDVQMPKLTGFELLELLDHPSPSIIFTTAYDQFAFKAFEINAIDYLLKPITEERFKIAIDKWILSESTKNTHSSVMNEIKVPDHSLKRLVVKNAGMIKIIEDMDIIMIEANDDYIKIYSSEGVFQKKATLSGVERQLSTELFFRAHRSYIVAIQQVEHIETIVKDQYEAKLKSGYRVPLSKPGFLKLKQLLQI